MEKNISFEHSLRHSFMHITNIEISENAYETRLLKETQVPGTLKLNINSDLSGTTLSYDISGLETIEKYFENHSLSYSEISVLIESLNTLLGSLEEYMISENSVSLTPSSIFFDPENRKWNFTVIPEYKNEFHKDLSCFLSYLLKHINYSDDRAVIMAYSLFQESNKEFYQMTDLLRIVRANMAKEIKAGEIRNVLTSENTAAQDAVFQAHNSMNPYPPSSFASGPRSSSSTDTMIRKPLSADGIFRPIDAGIVLNSGKDTIAPSDSVNMNLNSAYQAHAGIPQAKGLADTARIPSQMNIKNDSFAQSQYDQMDNISFSSDYGKDDYLKDDPVTGVEIHDISKESNAAKNGLFSFNIKNKNERSKFQEPEKESSTIKEHIDEKNKNSSLKAKVLISVLLMLLIPSLVWFLKGGLIFKKALPLIIALEIGLSMMIALDFIMNKLPDETVE